MERILKRVVLIVLFANKHKDTKALCSSHAYAAVVDSGHVVLISRIINVSTGLSAN